jgi:hypothetical protein
LKNNSLIVLCVKNIAQAFESPLAETSSCDTQNTGSAATSGRPAIHTENLKKDISPRGCDLTLFCKLVDSGRNIAHAMGLIFLK